MRTQLKDLTQTSLDAYHNLKPSKIRHDYEALLKAISANICANNMMLHIQLGLPINCVTARVYELRKLGKIELAKKDFCPHTKNLTMFWRIK